jgi:hypothetical protein
MLVKSKDGNQQGAFIADFCNAVKGRSWLGELLTGSTYMIDGEASIALALRP